MCESVFVTDWETASAFATHSASESGRRSKFESHSESEKKTALQRRFVSD